GTGACRTTGAPLTIHQPNRASAVHEILRILDEEQAPPDRVILGHMSSVPEFDVHLEALRRGFWIAYDNFGMNLRNAWFRGTEDEQRVAWTAQVVAEGYGRRLVLSQAVWCKAQLLAYGGNGYGHILRTIVPALRDAGLSQDEIEQLIVHNPADVLAF